MLVGRRFPDLDSSDASSDDPGTENNKLLDRLMQGRRDFQMPVLFASLEYPNTNIPMSAILSPCC